MAFKPKTAISNQAPRDPFISVVPKAGPRKARISMIVELGIQPRKDFEEKDGSTVARKPCQQVAIFADLVNDVVDYGGEIGEAQYRLMLNKSFMGNITGIATTTSKPRDANGKQIDKQPYQWHAQSMLAKVAKAIGKPNVALEDRKDPESLDMEKLLNGALIVQVEVKETVKEKDGKEVVYKNVSLKGVSQVPLDDDDNPVNVAKLTAKPMCITFDSATVDQVKLLRNSLREMIKKAEDYPGTAMQAAIEAYEATLGDGQAPAKEKEEASKVAPKTTAKAKKVVVEEDESDEDQSPF